MPRPDPIEVLEQFFREHPEGVVSAYLFGSHAHGTAHRESDIDVAVLFDRNVFPASDQRFEQRVRLTNDLIAALKHNEVDVIVLNDVPPQLARVALRGRRVFCRDSEADHAFTRTTLSRAADLEPFLRRVRRLKLDAIARK
jgi:predicted nucleotidyltransferase